MYFFKNSNHTNNYHWASYGHLFINLFFFYRWFIDLKTESPSLCSGTTSRYSNSNFSGRSKNWQVRCLSNLRAMPVKFFDLDDLNFSSLWFQFLMMSEDPQILTWLAKLIYYGFSKINDIHWNISLGMWPPRLHMLTILYSYGFYTSFLCTVLFIILSTFLYIDSRNMHLFRYVKICCGILHVYLLCILCSFCCFTLLWSLCQKWRNKRAYIYIYIERERES